MAYFRPLELEMDMEAAMRGVPIIAVMLVPPNISRVVSRVVMARTQVYLSYRVVGDRPQRQLQGTHISGQVVCSRVITSGNLNTRRRAQAVHWSFEFYS